MSTDPSDKQLYSLHYEALPEVIGLDIAVIGTGYVGITTAAALAEMGHRVTGVDVDKQKIEQLSSGKLTIYEPGVEELLQQLISQGALHFTTSLREALAAAEIAIIAVGTPALEDGGTDLKAVEAVAAEIGRHLNNRMIIVNKSTVPVGTAERVQSIVAGQLKLRKQFIAFEVVSNPEFLQEGAALRGSRSPDRIIVGCSSPAAEQMMLQLYEKVNAPLIVTTPRNAEMIKYASNSFLATKISFMNELARLCDLLEVDVTEVAAGMGADRRIGPSFLQAGIGYGGSCFPKDTAALIKLGRERQMPLTMIERTQQVNMTQPDWFVEKVSQRMNGLKGKQIALLGLSFKPDTDDIREATSLKLIQGFLKADAIIRGYDPVANDKLRNLYRDVQIAEDAYVAAAGADAIVLCTEWKQIVQLDWREIKRIMAGDFIFDGRNALDGIMLRREGFKYWGVGRNAIE